MKKLLLGFLIALLLPLSLPASGWNLNKLRQSTAQLSFSAEPDSVCTATAIGPKNVFVTAAHCKPEEGGIIADGWLTLRELWISEDPMGLMVLKGEADKHYPALKIGKEPTPGTPALMCGFPSGSPEMLCSPAPFQALMQAPDGSGMMSWFAGRAGGGMSGGPIVNEKGELISLVLGGFAVDDNLAPWSVGSTYKAVETAAKLFSDK